MQTHSSTVNRGSAQRTEKSVRARNLSRLSKQVEPDLLAAAIMIQESRVRAMLQGREPVRDEYAQEIGIHLTAAGFPVGWLDSQDAPITSKQLRLLREAAAQSIQKSPIRRDNFGRLVQAFSERLPVLADALELIETSIHSIVSGASVFDEHRMGHINPRLMAAGFPNNWLEMPNAEWDMEWLAGLETLATDSYEKDFEEVHVAAPVTTEYDAAIAAQIQALTTATQDTSASVRAEVHTPHSTRAATKAGVMHAPVTITTVNQIKEDSNMGTYKATPEVTSAKSTSEKSSIPGISHRLRAAGRPTGKVSSEGAVPSTKAMLTSQPPAKTEPTLEAKEVQLELNVATPVADAQINSSEKLTKEQSLVRSGALEKLLDSARRGAKVCLWRDILGKSLAYWGNIKKADIVFRDELANITTSALELPAGWLDNPVFPPATLAAWVHDSAVPLPVQPQSTPAALLTPPAPVAPSAAKLRAVGMVGRPTNKSKQVKAAMTPVKITPQESIAATEALAPVVVAEPIAAAPVVSAPAPVVSAAAPVVLAAAPVAPPVMATPSVPVTAAPVAPITPSVPVATAPVAPVAPAPLSRMAAMPVMPTDAADGPFAWEPSTAPIARATPGPLTRLLLGQMQQMAMAGTFSEQDAYRLICVLMPDSK